MVSAEWETENLDPPMKDVGDDGNGEGVPIRNVEDDGHGDGSPPTTCGNDRAGFVGYRNCRGPRLLTLGD